MSTAHDDAPRGFVPMADHMALQRKCDHLEEELAFARGMLRLDFVTAIQCRLKLTTMEASIVAALYGRHHLSKSGIYDFLYGSKPDAPDPKIVDVFICKLRKKLRDTDAPQDTVHTLWGSGYSLTPEGREWVASKIPELAAKGARP